MQIAGGRALIGLVLIALVAADASRHWRSASTAFAASPMRLGARSLASGGKATRLFCLVPRRLGRVGCSISAVGMSEKTGVAGPDGSEARGPHDLLVIGAGTRGIGGRVIQSYRKIFPDAKIVGETKTTEYHDVLRKLGCIPRTCDDADPTGKFPNVLISTPPNLSKKMLDASEEEEKEAFRSIVRRAVSFWDGTGRCIFTSAGSCYLEVSGGTVTEESPVKDDHTMRQCEVMVTEAGGTALRLSALYGFGRGGLWGCMGRSAGVDPDMTLELLSYDDAASACISVMLCDKGLARGQVFNVCDGEGRKVPEIFASCGKVWEYREKAVPEMTGKGNNVLGKRFDTTKIRSTGWKPLWETFDQWCEAHSKGPNPATNGIIIDGEDSEVSQRAA